MDDIVIKLLSRLRLCISTSECQEHFDAAINHSFSDLTPLDKFKGITPLRKLLMIENAISLLQDYCEQHQHNHNFTIQMFPVVFKTLKSLIAVNNVNISNTTSPSKVTIQPVNKTAPNGPIDKKTQKKKKQPRVSRVKVAKPDTAVLPSLYVKIKEDVVAGRAQQKHKHMTCNLQNCNFCLVMLQTVHLSACKAVHPKQKPCVPEGWYPHVGIGLWTRLRKYHDQRLPCKIKAVEPKEYELHSVKAYFKEDYSMINGFSGRNPDDDEADAQFSELNFEVDSELSQFSVASDATNSSVSTNTSLETMTSAVQSMLRDRSPLRDFNMHSPVRRRSDVIDNVRSERSKRPKHV